MRSVALQTGSDARAGVGRLTRFGPSVPVEELRMAAGTVGRRVTQQEPMGGWVEPGEQGAPNGAPCGSSGKSGVLERHEVREIRPGFESWGSVRRTQCEWPGATSVYCQPAASSSEVGCPLPMARECGRSSEPRSRHRRTARTDRPQRMSEWLSRSCPPWEIKNTDESWSGTA